MNPEYGDYRYFRSPVTDKFVLEGLYVMEGWHGIAQPSSILIDMRAYSVQLRHMIDELQSKIVEVSQATYILQTPFEKLPESQALSELTPGIMTQSAGVVSTLTLQNEYLIMGKRVNNVDNVPTPTLEIGLVNFPDFPEEGQIWVGVRNEESGKIRPTPTSYTPFTNEAPFVINEPYEGLPNAQSISELGFGILKSSTGGLIKIANPGVDYATLSQIEALQAQIDGILGSISALELEILLIQGQLLVIDGQIYALQLAVSGIQTEILGITASIVAINSRIDNLRLNTIPADADVSIGHKLTNVTAGSNPLDAVNYAQLEAAIGGAGTVTQISAGDNIVCGPNPITTTGTISLNQNIVVTTAKAGNINIGSNVITNNGTPGDGNLYFLPSGADGHSFIGNWITVPSTRPIAYVEHINTLNPNLGQDVSTGFSMKNWASASYSWTHTSSAISSDSLGFLDLIASIPGTDDYTFMSFYYDSGNQKSQINSKKLTISEKKNQGPVKLSIVNLEDPSITGDYTEAELNFTGALDLGFSLKRTLTYPKLGSEGVLTLSSYNSIGSPVYWTAYSVNFGGTLITKFDLSTSDVIINTPANPYNPATKAYVDNAVSPLVQSVSGTSGRISATGGVNPIIDLVATAVSAGTYTNSTITVDAYGRLTAASSGTAPVNTISGTANQITVSGTTSATIGIANNPIIPGNGSITVPVGTTAQRPGSPANGMVRANTDLGRIEGYISGSWYSFVPLQSVTQYCVLAGGASNAISSIGPGTAGQLLQSGGNAANPSYTSTPGSGTPLTSIAVGSLTASGTTISSTGNIQLSAISSGGVGIGTSGPSRMLQVSRGASAGVGGTVLIENTVGSTGASARLDLNTYSINPLFDPCVRIAAIDTGNASGDLVISIKPNGSSSNTLVNRLGIYQTNTNMFAQYLRWDNSTRNRSITLYDGGNDHQYIGLGYNSGTMRYQVDSTSSQHVWYAGTSSSASNEIMRLTGGGSLLLPGTTFSDRPRASFSSYGGSSVTPMTTAGTYYMITFPTTGATVSTSLNFFSYITGSRFTYTGAQSVPVRISYNITAGTNGASGEITTFDIVAGKTSTLASRRIILASTYSMISISCVVTLNTNDYIELFVTHSINSRNLTVYDVQWDII